MAHSAGAILKDLKSLGKASYKKVLLNHGVNEPVFGVKISELKKIQKRIGTDYKLSKSLYESGNYDAQYLAGLIADPTHMTKKDFRQWLAASNAHATCGFVVAALTAESKHGWPLALEWIESEDERDAQTGWDTLAGIVATRNDADLDLPTLKRLLDRVGKSIHQQPNYVRYAMNGFLISVGAYVRTLSDRAIDIGESVGEVHVDMGRTACKVPFAPDYIRKCLKHGSLARKRKPGMC